MKDHEIAALVNNLTKVAQQYGHSGQIRMQVRNTVLAALESATVEPLDMVLHCPSCGTQHIDKSESVEPHYDANRGYVVLKDDTPNTWTNPPHRSHLCHKCNYVWRPADIATNGVASVRTKGKNDSMRPGDYVLNTGDML